MKKLTFILPVYNGEQYILRCLYSVFSQNYPNIELIVINDGSTDNSMKKINYAIKKYNTKNYSVTCIEQENSGVANSRSLGISIARGDYVTFIDQDDYIGKNFCTDFMSIVENNDYDMVIGGFCRKNASGKTTRAFIPSNHSWAKYCLTYPWARIIKRSFLADNNIHFLKTSIGEDIYFDIIAYAHTDNIYMLRNCSYVWFDNPKSVSNTEYTKISNIVNPIYTFDCIMADLPAENNIEQGYLEYYFIKFIVWFLLTNVRNSSYKDILSMHDKLFSWLEKNFPHYKSNKLIGVFTPKGDTTFNRIAVTGYIQLHKLNMDTLLLRLLSKKRL